jgi:hypothetical protein
VRQSAAADEGTKLPVLHLLTKTVDFFLKQRVSAPLSGVTGRRSQTEKRAPDLFHEITTSVEGEA